MAATSRTLQKAATRAKVLAAAKALFDAEGYQAVTIRGLAAAVGMSTGAVFTHWSDKEALYREVYGHAPITPELGRALYLAGLRAVNVDVPQAETLVAVLTKVVEA